jgi:hypothetical protein
MLGLARLAMAVRPRRRRGLVLGPGTCHHGAGRTVTVDRMVRVAQ